MPIIGICFVIVGVVVVGFCLLESPKMAEKVKVYLDVLFEVLNGKIEELEKKYA